MVDKNGHSSSYMHHFLLQMMGKWLPSIVSKMRAPIDGMTSYKAYRIY